MTQPMRRAQAGSQLPIAHIADTDKPYSKGYKCWLSWVPQARDGEVWASGILASSSSVASAHLAATAANGAKWPLLWRSAA